MPDRDHVIQPTSGRVCNAACAMFALWTLSCHINIAIGGSLVTVILVFFLAVLLLGLMIARRRRSMHHSRPVIDQLDTSTTERHSTLVFRGVGFALGVGVLALVHLNGASILLWWFLVPLLAVACVVFVLKVRPIARCAMQRRSWELTLWVICIVCVMLTLVTHRPDIDDAFYVNLAVAAADEPGEPLLIQDTMHGIEGLPLMLPVYRVHSFELLNGALAYITGIPAIYCFHWITAALAALLVPLAYAKLFRILTPQRWLWAVVTVLVVLVAAGETHQWYGNLAFVRMWQGKAVFVSVFTPLIYAYGLSFALRPRPGTWFLLAAAQISAVGCSSSALWAAPVGAVVGLCAAVPPTLKGLRVVGIGVLTSAYVVVLGLLLRPQIPFRNSVRIAQGGGDAGNRLDQTLGAVLGDSYLWIAGALCLLLAWACCRRDIGQRFAIVSSLFGVVLLFNPFAANWVISWMTGPTYWRAMWGVPIPTLLTLVIVAPLFFENPLWLRRTGRVMFFGLLVTFACVIPKYSSISPLNRNVDIDWPHLKVDLPEYRRAGIVNRNVPPGSVVAVPMAVGRWIPTFHHPAAPLVVRPPYLSQIRRALGKKNVEARMSLSRFVGGRDRSEDSVQKFANIVQMLGVDAVGLQDFPGAGDAGILLRESGFTKVAEDEGFEVWLRDDHRPPGNQTGL